ncbi:importin subunit alpha-5-like isoform X2 [Daphnia pulex]|nr:importin subunit alpha-5-like isoform X2 [Daphnia pulex]
MNSREENKEITAIRAVRILTKKRNPPIDILINANIITKLVEFLSRVNNPDLQFESAWSLINIALGTSAQTKAVVSAGAVSPLISLLGSPHQGVAEGAVLALDNLFVIESELRDDLIEQGVVNSLLVLLIKPDTSTRLLHNVTLFLCNLCRNEDGQLTIPAVRQLLPVLAHLIHNNDKEILVDACRALTYLTGLPSDLFIQIVVDAGVVPRLVSLLSHKEVDVIFPSLLTIGNIASVDSLINSVLTAGACPMLAKLLVRSEMNIVKYAAWTVSNIAYGNAVQIQALVTDNVIRPLVEVLGKGNFQCRKEAAWAITNITWGGNIEQIDLLCQYGAIASLCSLLEAKECSSETIVAVLEGLFNILAVAKKMGELEKVSLQVEECGGQTRIVHLQSHENIEVYHKAHAILGRYFSTPFH